MISPEQLLLEMERQVSLAKQAANEQERREAVSAVRSLCNVLLNDSAKPPLSSGYPKVQQLASANPAPIQAQPVVSLNEQPLQEEDANGESLFDF